MSLQPEKNIERLLGVVYTPDEVASELTRFALKRYSASPQTILEPSAGDGAFLRAIRMECKLSSGVKGFDVDANAVKSLRIEFPFAEFECRDFIDFAVNYRGSGFDVIIGNPPYIRRQNFVGPVKDSIKQLSQISQYPLSELKNAWAAFVVASSRLLSRTGVLAFIVPYELLNVRYGQYLQAYLAETFGSVEVFSPQDKAFRHLDQDAVALVATKVKQRLSGGLTMISVKALSKLEPIESRKIHFDNGKVSTIDLSSVLFDSETANLLHKLRSRLSRIGDYASSSAGVVSAANSFFILRSSEIDKRGLRDWARPILKKGTFLPPGPVFSTDHMDELLRREPAFLLDFFQEGAPKLSREAIKYIAEGEALGLDARYKSRRRSPWYKIPIVDAADGLFFKRSHSFPRLCINEASVLATDTAYQIKMHDGFGIRDLCYSFYNSLTLLFCEMDGRFYGGGVLELTPNEFRGLPVLFQRAREEEFVEFLQMFPQSKAPNAADFDYADRRLANLLSLSEQELLMVREALRTVKGHRLRHGSWISH